MDTEVIDEELDTFPDPNGEPEEGTVEPLLWRRVTCRTPHCENENITIVFPCVEYVICGACMQQITDVYVVPESQIPEEPGIVDE